MFMKGDTGYSWTSAFAVLVVANASLLLPARMIQVNNDCTSRIKTERGHEKKTYMVLLFLEWLCCLMASVRSCLPWLFLEWLTVSVFRLHSIHEVCPSPEYGSCIGRHHFTCSSNSHSKSNGFRGNRAMKNFDFRSLAGSGAVAGGQYLRSEHRGCRCRCRCS